MQQRKNNIETFDVKYLKRTKWRTSRDKITNAQITKDLKMNSFVDNIKSKEQLGETFTKIA